MATPQGPAPSGTVALDQLQAMVNLVLMQTGQIFKDPKKASSTKNQYTLKRAIPAAVDRFHDSLDELEDEIHRAQAVFRRDLALIRADRLKREQAEAAERQRAAAAATGKASKPAAPQKKPDDVMRGVEALLMESNPPAKDKKPEAPPPPEPAKQQPFSASKAPPASAPAPVATASIPAPINTAAAPAHDPLFDATPTTANLQDTVFDFDSMFNDDPTGPADSTAHNDTSNDLSFDLGGDDGQSLLRGLEDFANSGPDNVTGTQNASTSNGDAADFSMLDLSSAPAPGAGHPGPQDILAAVGQMSSGPPQQETLPAQDQQVADEIMSLDVPSASFDDLFEWGGNQEDTNFEDQFMNFGD